MHVDPPTDEFLQALTAAQTSLYTYILALLPDRVAAQDVLQEANLTIWRKHADFVQGTGFMAWSSKIAYFQVLSHRRKMSRDRLIFDENVLSYLAERQAERAPEVSQRALLLKKCLEKLPAEQRGLVEQRYAPDGSVDGIAQATGKTAGAISQTLFRIRQVLLTCVELKLTLKETI